MYYIRKSSSSGIQSSVSSGSSLLISCLVAMTQRHICNTLIPCYRVSHVCLFVRVPVQHMEPSRRLANSLLCCALDPVAVEAAVARPTYLQGKTQFTMQLIKGTTIKISYYRNKTKNKMLRVNNESNFKRMEGDYIYM